ncbi:glycosyltransferase family 2 protein [Mycobacterium aquaticum]|uniref:Glycosyltransferase 2-like domain-containing protein n=1 Tax=Mycobacterium aquaticum TaxID=1927124 RepID=A0A1X0AA89_9MYCO|nr:glycosyltransferase [Mycobacterium aquaticum]ORA26991.1 hypothetical protein BST13_31095 [Mycobacterium aquaticum]
MTPIGTPDRAEPAPGLQTVGVGGPEKDDGELTPSRPFVSVLIATYNHAAYLAETLDSVARQTFTDYEIVVVDDGSTDGTDEIVSAWSAEYARAHDNAMRVTRIDNSGQSAAIEHGFGLCTGDYIALLDSDDRWEPNKLAAVNEAVRECPEAGMVVHPLHVIDTLGRRTGDTRPLRARLSEGDLRDHVRRTGRQIAPATSGVVIRSDVFAQLLPMPTRRFRSAADAYLTLGATLAAPVRAIHEPLGEYRMHPDSMYLRRTISPEGLRTTVEMQRAIARHLGIEAAAEKNPHFMRHAFALAVFEESWSNRWRQFRRLIAATLTDQAHRPLDRLIFSAYWTVCLLAPAGVFARLWRFFQIRHIGTNRIPDAARISVHGEPSAH